MQHISTCFGWFLDGLEAHFIDSDHPNASLIIDQILVIREDGSDKKSMDVLASLMEGAK